MKKTSDEIYFQMRIRNSLPKKIDLYLEAWGDQYKMKPGATFTILAKGPKEDCLEIEYEEDKIIVYGWPGSVVSILQEENESG